MSDNEEGQEKSKGGKGKLLAFLATIIGAAVAFLMFWKRRGSSDERGRGRRGLDNRSP